MKKLVIVAALVLAVATLAGCGIQKFDQQTAQEPIKIGAVYPLSGQLAMYGTEYKRGIDLAVDEINKSGGVKGRPLEIIYEDDGGDTAKSVTAVQKLINVDKVKYILTGFSSPSQATAPIAEQNKIVYISATVSKIGTGNYVFRDYWDMEDAGIAIGKALIKDGIKKVGIIALNYGDTQYYLKGLKSAAVGVRFQEEKFNFGDADFKSQLTKIKSVNPQAVIVYGFPGAEATKITQQMKELGLNNLRLYAGATTYIFPFMYEQFKELLVKMKAVDNNYDLDSASGKAAEYQNKYTAKYGTKMVTSDSTYTYDDIYALTEALNKSKDINDTKEVSDNLRQTNIAGAAGTLKFDAKGNSLRPIYLQIFTNQGWQEYK